jgi:hypothetical protein
MVSYPRETANGRSTLLDEMQGLLETARYPDGRTGSRARGGDFKGDKGLVLDGR